MSGKVPTLTRIDIARALSRMHGVKVADADLWVDAVLSAVRDLLMTADPEIRLEVRDFGVFEVRLTKAKPQARNPKTGDIVFIPPRRKTRFRPSKLLRRFLTKSLEGEASTSPDGETFPSAHTRITPRDNVAG